MAKDLGSGSGLLTAALPWVQGDPKSTVSFVPFVEQLGRAASLGFYCQCCSQSTITIILSLGGAFGSIHIQLKPTSWDTWFWPVASPMSKRGCLRDTEQLAKL